MGRCLAITVGLLLLLLGGLAVPARADEELDSALARLTPEERAHLAAKIPGWDELASERKERIAQNLIRFRDLPPDERAWLERRIERLEGARRAGRGPSPHHRRHGFPDEGHRHRLKKRSLLMRAVGATLWADLPVETRTALTTALGDGGRRGLEMAFYRRLWDDVARTRAAAGVPDVEISDEAPAHFRRMVEQWRKEAAAGDEKARLHLARMAIGNDARLFVKGLDAEVADDPQELARVGSVFVARHPEAFERAKAELVKVAADPEALRRYTRRGHFPGGRNGKHWPGGSPEDRARMLLWSLEWARPYLERHPELAKQAEELREGLRRVLGKAAEGRGPGGRWPWPKRPGTGPAPSSPWGAPGGGFPRPGPRRPKRPEHPGGDEEK